MINKDMTPTELKAHLFDEFSIYLESAEKELKDQPSQELDTFFLSSIIYYFNALKMLTED